MESPSSSTEEPAPQPTAGDIENARIRQEIAARQLAEYVEVLKWSIGAFGEGWVPSHRHFLVSKEEEERVRYKGERPTASATVYTVKNAEGDRRHFTVVDGQVVRHESMEAGFGEMLLQPHETRGFEHRGQIVRIHK